MSNGVVVYISLYLQRRSICKTSLIKQAFHRFGTVRTVSAASDICRNVSNSELHTWQVLNKSSNVQLLSAASLSSTEMAAMKESAGHIMLADMKLVVDVSGAKEPVVLKLSSDGLAESSHWFDSSSLSPHRHADSASGSHGNAHQNLFAIIHRNGFDSQYRIKRSVPFSLSLAGVRGALEAEGIEHWTLHCTTGMYGQQVEQPGINIEHSGHYARGFLIAQQLTDKLIASINKHGFSVFLQLSRKLVDDGHDVWRACSPAADAEAAGDDGKSYFVHTCAFNSVHPVFVEPCNNSIFHSIDELKDVLRQAQDCQIEGAGTLLQYLDVVSGDASSSQGQGQCYPLVVIEGLDASGKTTIVERMVRHLGVPLVNPVTIQLSIEHLLPVYQPLPPVLRRAYFSTRNYVMSHDIRRLRQQSVVIVDRLWYSTAAYAIGEEIAMPASDTHWLYKWPRDIVVPDLVLLLVVSEAQRCSRMQSRVDTGDISMTVEETQLARDALKRARILEAYRKMRCPHVMEVNADGTRDEVWQQVLDILHQQQITSAEHK